MLKLSGRALAALGRSQAWLWGSGAVLGADGAVPAGASLGRALAQPLSRAGSAQRRFSWCASRHLRVLTDLDVTWRTACACALRAR